MPVAGKVEQQAVVYIHAVLIDEIFINLLKLMPVRILHHLNIESVLFEHRFYFRNVFVYPGKIGPATVFRHTYKQGITAGVERGEGAVDVDINRFEPTGFLRIDDVEQKDEADQSR